MQLQELVEHLSAELAQRNLGWDTEEGLHSGALKRIIPFINLGLIALYTRFPLKTNHIKIRLFSHIEQYKLHYDYAQSNFKSPQPVRYLEDNPPAKPFYDRVLKIDQVFNSCGCELPLNNSKACDSLFTPATDILQIPCPVSGDAVDVIYRAAPNKLSNECDLTQDIEIPYAYVNALVYFVVSKILGGRDKVEAAQEAQLYKNNYERECIGLEMYGVAQKDNDTNTKLCERGFI